MEKENSQKCQVEQKLSPPQQTKQVSNESKIKQELLMQMLLDSPDFKPASTPSMKTSPQVQPFRRSLFDSTPGKQEQKHQVQYSIDYKYSYVPIQYYGLYIGIHGCIVLFGQFYYYCIVLHN
jgi:hypothetical protein